MLELRLRYTGNGTFQTAGRRDWELADAELEPGAVLRARIWRPRSVRQNDFFHALIEAAFESQRGGPRLPTWRHLKAYLLIQAGHCEEVRLRLGQRQTEGEAVTMAGTLAQALRRVGLGRQHARAGWLEFTQAKNRNRRPVRIEIPILPQLQEVLEVSPTGDLTYLVTEQGRPFSVAGFGNWFRARCNEASLQHCSAHGLRKAGAATAAENGATTQQLMAIFGWLSLAEAERYTRAAERKRLAAAAMPTLVRNGQ